MKREYNVGEIYESPDKTVTIEIFEKVGEGLIGKIINSKSPNIIGEKVTTNYLTIAEYILIKYKKSLYNEVIEAIDKYSIQKQLNL